MAIVMAIVYLNVPVENPFCTILMYYIIPEVPLTFQDIEYITLLSASTAYQGITLD